MPFFQLKQELAQSIAKAINHPDFTSESIFSEFSTPPNVSLGHVALPCFRMGKTLGKPAGKLAQELEATMKSATLSVKATGPYVNFKFDPGTLYRSTLQAITEAGPRYGSSSVGSGKKVLLEYCSPNIAKRLGFQHIRSTLIGSVLSNIYKFLGYDVGRINFVGDWGSQFARLVAAFELWGESEKLSPDRVRESMDHLFQIYVRFHKEVDTHPEYLEQANRCLQRMESGEPKIMALWKTIRDISILSMNATLKRMNVGFDYVEGESHYVSHIDKTLTEIKAKTGARISEGAWIVELEGIPTPALIQKRDGTTLYLTRDIAGAIDRYQRFDFHKLYYVVSEQQRLHFQQLFATLKAMGHTWSDRCEHLSFGTVLFGAEKMSTREGRVIVLDDLLNEARDLALVECSNKNPDLANKEEVAEMVGVGAIIFGELSAHRTRDIEFDWKSILALDGETGPYVQYSAVRCQSLFQKAAEKGITLDKLPSSDGYGFSLEEEALLLTLANFSSVLQQVTQDNEPYHLTHYLIDLAKNFNRFYYRLPVLQATEASHRDIRLSLVRATETVLKNGLELLGIRCPAEM